MELHFYNVIEALKYKGDLRFISDKEDPGNTGMIINKCHKPPFPRGGTFKGPQTALWIRVNSSVGLYGYEGKESNVV